MKKYYLELKDIMYTDWKREEVRKNRLQMSLGMLIENNVVNMMEEYCTGLSRLPEHYDICFGADFKMAFNNGTESFVDVTCNDKKLHDIINYKGVDMKIQLEYGRVAYVGMKRRNANLRYRKPILVLYIKMNGSSNTFFSIKEIKDMQELLSRGSSFISWNLKTYFNGKEERGCGNGASELVRVTSDFLLERLVENRKTRHSEYK